jgi:hypothetical protein
MYEVSAAITSDELALVVKPNSVVPLIDFYLYTGKYYNLS